MINKAAINLYSAASSMPGIETESEAAAFARTIFEFATRRYGKTMVSSGSRTGNRIKEADSSHMHSAGATEMTDVHCPIQNSVAARLNVVVTSLAGN